MAVMQPTTIKASITAYSTAVGPSSSRRKSQATRANWTIRAPLLLSAIVWVRSRRVGKYLKRGCPMQTLDHERSGSKQPHRLEHEVQFDAGSVVENVAVVVPWACLIGQVEIELADGFGDVDDPQQVIARSEPSVLVQAEVEEEPHLIEMAEDGLAAMAGRRHEAIAALQVYVRVQEVSAPSALGRRAKRQP